MKIEFRAKLQTVHAMSGEPLYQYLTVPTLARKHVDMPAARRHPKYGGLANSDLFPGVLASIQRATFPGGILRLDRVPDGVHVDTSGFLACVAWEAWP